MSTPYASGKHALGLCDRCGRQRKLSDLIYQILDQKNTNWLVCPEDCWEQDQPQYQIGRYPIQDPQAIQNPRPDQDNDRGMGLILLEDGGGICLDNTGATLLLVTTPTNLVSQ